jgi:hypothetical protein
VLGKSSINLTALTTYEAAKAPRPHGDLVHPKFFEPAHRQIVFTNASIEVVIFTLALLSIWVLNQQEFREEPVPHSISGNSFLPRRCFWSSRLQGIPAVRLDFSEGNSCPGSTIVSRPPAGHGWILSLGFFLSRTDFSNVVFHNALFFCSFSSGPSIELSLDWSDVTLRRAVDLLRFEAVSTNVGAVGDMELEQRH